MSDIQAPNAFETNETLDGAADIMEVYQPGSGGIRRNKKAFLNTLGMFFRSFIGRKDVTSDITMESNEKYLISGDYNLALPASSVKGDVIDILSDGYPKINQSDAEHAINYLDKYFTTKGATGSIQLFSKNSLVTSV